MKRIFLIVGIIIIGLWLIGFFAFNITTPAFHLLIIAGVISVVIDILSRRPNWR